MVIGIIGAGIAGLTAGRLLAKAGHEVTILEKSRGLGGRMATRYAGNNDESKMDHGIPYFRAYSPEFQSFTAELLEKGIVKLWGDKLSFYNGEKLTDKNPYSEGSQLYASVDGMNNIGKYLSRWVDVKTESRVAGMTHIGSNRSKKRSWMINMSASNTFEADAVIIATPAPQAYGLINTTIDEISTLKIVREIDEVHYNPSYSLMLGYGDAEVPVWDGIVCKNSIIDFISNETSKRGEGQECSVVVHTSADFARKNRKKDEDLIKREILGELSEIIGGWAVTPKWDQLHFWRYSRPVKSLNVPYLEIEEKESPLAMIGDFFEGNDIDAAYRSGYKLATHWIEKFGNS
jgi:renalase